jgi:hypothetical protein
MADAPMHRGELRTTRRGLWGVKALIAIEIYTVAVYLAGAVLWHHYPPRPTFVWLLSGWLVLVPGFWIAVLGPGLAAVITVGASVLLARRRDLPPRLRCWCIAATVLVAAYGVSTLTPLADTIGWTIPY